MRIPDFENDPTLTSDQVKRRRYYYANREVAKVKAKEWVQKNPEKAKETRRAYREKNRERIKEWFRAHYRGENEPRRRKRASALNNYYRNRELLLARSKAANITNKIAVMNAYGNGHCKCCGESQIEFLSLDHVFNDGGKIRKMDGGHTGGRLYRRLKRDGFPNKDRFQVLCHNCNMAKAHHGTCPHEVNAIKFFGLPNDIRVFRMDVVRAQPR